jgi:shikimate kinase
MNIVLVGFAGTGKTTVGRLLAGMLKKNFLDTNEIIEGREASAIARLTQVKGSLYVREAEDALVAEMAALDDCVIAVGANAILNLENLARLKKNGVLVCLTADPAIIVIRTAPSRESSALLKSANALATIRQILKEREQSYARADHTIDTSDLTPAQVAESILRALRMPGAGR